MLEEKHRLWDLTQQLEKHGSLAYLTDKLLHSVLFDGMLPLPRVSDILSIGNMLTYKMA